MKYIVMNPAEPNKILITGADGYIGSNLVVHLAKEGYQPMALLRKDTSFNFPPSIETRAGDLGNDRFLSEAVKDVDIIIHLAGHKGYEQCSSEIARTFHANISFTERLVNAVGKNKKKIIFASTYWVYGHKAPLPYHDDLPIMPSEPYGWSKALAERLIISSGLNYIILRLTNVFGYGIGKRYNEVTSFFLKNAFNGKPVSLHNAGQHSIDLISIDDVCKIITKMIHQDNNNLILNLGSGDPVSILKLSEVVNTVSKKLTGNEAAINVGKKESDEILFANRWVDSGRLKMLTGFTPAPLIFSLEQFAKSLLSEQ